jgi:hypothetical protein
MAINPAGTFPPELYEQQQQLNRQQQMAQLLMQQSQQQPQGQMVSGRYVAPSFFQNVLPLAQMYAGTRMAEQGDKKALELAAKLRQRYGDEIKEFRNLMQGREELAPEQAGPTQTGQAIPQEMVRGAPNVQGAYDFAATAYNPTLQAAGLRKLTEGPIKVGIEDSLIDPVTMKPVFTGAGKPRTPIQIDTGTAIELRDPRDPTVVLQRIPKSQMPTAGQVVETADGPMIVNTRTGEATPIMAGGQAIAPKLTAEQSKDIVGINQQRATINGAIADVEKNKSAFSFGRGLAQNAPYGESIAGRFEKPEDTQARSYVFNNVSAVIKERAGTAQSAQELTRINSFLPATTDNADQIISKLKGFNQYLDDQEKGTRVSLNKKPAATQPTSFSSEADVQKAITSGGLKKGDKVTVNGVTGTIQ